MKISPTHKIGIWGLGVSGLSILRYCTSQQARVIAVLDRHSPSPETTQLLTQYASTFYHDPQERDTFFATCDIVIPSPGIDLAALPPAWRTKCVAELDIFYQAWRPLRQAQDERGGHEQGIKRNIIAITGTVGKTSITHLLTNLLQQAGIAAVSGGNIGTGMLDLLDHQKATHAVLELSSFQLEQSHEFAPDLAIWTNLYANHLDRHKTIEAYAAAKAQIFCRQTGEQQALLPLAARPVIEPLLVCEGPLSPFDPFAPSTTLRVSGERTNGCGAGGVGNCGANSQANSPLVPSVVEGNERAKTPLHAWFALDPENASGISNLFYRDAQTGAFMYRQGQKTRCILTAEEIPAISFAENWLIIAAAATLLGLDARQFIAKAQLPDLPHNRLEPVATIQGITYINDSKSTIIQATIAAVEALAPRSIILLLGGLSKGVDRIPHLAQLGTTGAIKHVICFGKEAPALFTGCQHAGLPATQCATLEEAVQFAHKQALLEQQKTTHPASSLHPLVLSEVEGYERAGIAPQENQNTPETCVLLSPGGTSFDLFKNYEERGARFAELAQALADPHAN